MKRIYTIGHSTLGIDDFLASLSAHCIETLADVRRYPGSRRHPHFNRDDLALSLAMDDLRYVWLPELGGRRSPQNLSDENNGWQVDAFHAYADYMRTEEFEAGLQRLMDLATKNMTAMMCAEALWTRCHRRLISDALTARGWEVRHILSATRVEPHKLTEFAHVEDGRLTYPNTNGMRQADDPRMVQ
jgi:uncharacterized protein (DUF488 family)